MFKHSLFSREQMMTLDDIKKQYPGLPIYLKGRDVPNCYASKRYFRSSPPERVKTLTPVAVLFTGKRLSLLYKKNLRHCWSAYYKLLEKKSDERNDNA